ncbi:MAG TPA: ribosome biogenesis GTPase Der [Stellaceae bacterium]|nr:ribosome biogenesis GTPase Der [Stellaceae bacterium]
MALKVAIVGRPNVGKSTLFNRLVGQKLALVDDTPGVTRDRREGEAALGDLRFRVIDTAGLDRADDGSLGQRMQEQTARALADADVALFVVDARDGLTPLDRHFADLLRRGSAPVVLVANKSEGRAGGSGALEAFALGLGEPVAISAEHGDGMAELYAALAPYADQAAGDEGEVATTERPLQLAIIGRPNVGKSTLVNRLVGEERLLTGPEAGITRDAITIQWDWQGRAVRLIDTAGLRRRPKVEEKLEKLSVADTLRAIRFAEVVVLVLDAAQMLEKQDLTIAHMVEEEGRALVLAVNKWDMVEDKSAALRKLKDRIEISLPQLHGVRFVLLSALTGTGMAKLMPAVMSTHAAWNRRISTPRLNRWLAAVQQRHPPPLVKGRRLKLRYMTQANIRPPTFALFAATPAALPDSYRRYLVNLMREDFDLPGVPIRMMLRKGENPYAGDK